MNRRNIRNCSPFRSRTNRSRRKCGKVDYRQLSSVSSVVLYDSAPSASRRKKRKAIRGGKDNQQTGCLSGEYLIPALNSFSLGHLYSWSCFSFSLISLLQA